jgi:hypothetical protein
MRVLCTFSGALMLTVVSYAQQPFSIRMKDPIVCYAKPEDHHFKVPLPEEYIRVRNGAKVKTSTIIVDYSGFTAEAQNTFQAAVDVWESLITSTVPIHIRAEWTALGSGVLGSAIYTTAFANFAGAQKLNVFYPVAVAEKIQDKELNPGEPDIFSRFSSSVNWHYNPTTTPPSVRRLSRRASSAAISLLRWAAACLVILPALRRRAFGAASISFKSQRLYWRKSTLRWVARPASIRSRARI